jgi:hypothetical protein
VSDVPSASALITTASVAGAVAAFYYTTQRGDVQAAATAPIPYGAERGKEVRKQIGRSLLVVAAVLVLHTPLTVLFASGAIDVVRGIDTSRGTDPGKVAVVVITGLCILHAWVIVGDLRSLMKRRRDLPPR